LSLGEEADHPEVKAWAHEIRAWIALTTGNYHGVVTAARVGIEAAPHHSVHPCALPKHASHSESLRHVKVIWSRQSIEPFASWLCFA